MPFHVLNFNHITEDPQLELKIITVKKNIKKNNGIKHPRLYNKLATTYKKTFHPVRKGDRESSYLPSRSRCLN